MENIAWNQAMPAVLLSGAHDRTCCVFDSRNPEAVARWSFDADVECLAWNPHDAAVFLAGYAPAFSAAVKAEMVLF